MRQYIKANDCSLPGWVKRLTKKTTAFMMTTKFASALVITIYRKRQLARPLKDFQPEYLIVLKVTSAVFTTP